MMTETMMEMMGLEVEIDLVETVLPGDELAAASGIEGNLEMTRLWASSWRRRHDDLDMLTDVLDLPHRRLLWWDQ